MERKHIKAAFLRKLGDVELREVVLRSPGLDEIHVRVNACGICGTDVTSALNGSDDYKPFGHEVAGTVLDAGAAVAELEPGRTIVLESASACGRCVSCKDCAQDRCLDVTSFLGEPSLGFAEEVLSPAISAVPYRGISPEVACLSEPLGVAIDLHRCADIRVGSHVVVSGLGTIGLMALRLAKLSGAERVYACDLSTASIRLQTALKFGADEIIEVDKTPIESHKFAIPPDRFMVSSPPRTIPAMIRAAGRAAVISYIGIEFGEGAAITFDANEFHFKKLQLRGSFASPAMYTPFAVRLLENGSIDGRSLITHTFELNDIGEALRVAALEPDKAIKVVVAYR